jgi:hypothetical protein
VGALGTEAVLAASGRAGVMSDEFEDGKKKFLEAVKAIDAAVEIVIPVTPSRGNFLIALSKGKARKFMSVSEDDILDLPEDEKILQKVTEDVKNAIAELNTA